MVCVWVVMVVVVGSRAARRGAAFRSRRVECCIFVCVVLVCWNLCCCVDERVCVWIVVCGLWCVFVCDVNVLL